MGSERRDSARIMRKGAFAESELGRCRLSKCASTVLKSAVSSSTLLNTIFTASSTSTDILLRGQGGEHQGV